MISSTEMGNGRNSRKGAGRHSCLLTFLIAFAITVLVGAGMYGAARLVSQGGFSSREAIAVIQITGVISSSEKTTKVLQKAGKNGSIKAVLIRVDSPGGGVAATQEIYQEILKVRKEKPVIVSMGSLAASGGLYVSAAADQIMANPATVTGSIGVIMQSVNLEDLLGKVGLTSVVIKSGKYKDIGSTTRPMTDEERELLQNLVDQLRGQFVHDLAKGRKLDIEKIDKIADGRIFTGADALELGLVDKLGNFEDAVDLAKNAADIKGDVNLLYPEEDKSWLRELLRGENPIKIMPEWTRNFSTFQYIYIPGI